MYDFTQTPIHTDIELPNVKFLIIEEREQQREREIRTVNKQREEKKHILKDFPSYLLSVID